jgi:hypothetical protein
MEDLYQRLNIIPGNNTSNNSTGLPAGQFAKPGAIVQVLLPANDKNMFSLCNRCG